MELARGAWELQENSFVKRPVAAGGRKGSRWRFRRETAVRPVCDDPHQEGLATHSPAVSGLASTPYNVAVGGTDFDEFNTWLNFWNSTNDSATGNVSEGLYS